MKNIAIVITVIFVVSLVLFISLKYDICNSKSNNNEKNVIENFPQNPISLLCTDINGDLITTSKIKLSNLNVQTRTNIDTNTKMDILNVGQNFTTKGNITNSGNHIIKEGSNQTITQKQTINGGQTINGNQTINGTKYIDGDLTCGSLSIMPSGSIVLWGQSTIPDGWVLCNGGDDGNGGKTPNLSGRFPLATNLSSSIGEIGGEKEVTLKLNQIPAHSHTYHAHGGTYSYAAGFEDNNHFAMGARGSDDDIDAQGGIGGVAKPHNNMPPYYVLRFIMKK
jgi:microcystin-dependent protein